MLLKGKVVLVTGGAGLLGSEFCRAICDAGGSVIVADINEVGGKTVVAKLPSGKSRFQLLDINAKDSVKECLKATSEQHGKLDAVVHCAYPRTYSGGRRFSASFLESDTEEFCANLKLQLGGAFLLGQEAGRFFSTQGYGNIIFLSSIYGVVPPRFRLYEGTEMTSPAEYGVIKAGVIHLTKYMARYFANKNIRVNSISPGGILHDQPAQFVANYRKECLNRGMLDKSDINGTLIYLLSEMSQAVNGQNIIVDDGFVL